MDISLVSSFTAEDEDRFVPVVLRVITEAIATLPVAYSIRIETAGGRVVQQHGPSIQAGESQPVVQRRKYDPSRR